MSTIAVCIPSIPIRPKLLNRALRSVLQQTYRAHEICVAVDSYAEGAWTTRNRAVMQTTSACEWVAFLDDDDEFLPHHLDHLVAIATETEADLVHSWFEVVGGSDPFPQHRGKQYHPYPHDNHHCFPITYMVKRDLLFEAREKMGGFLPDDPGFGAWEHQDMPLIDCMWELSDGNFYGSPVTTWRYHHHQENTSGLPSRWSKT